MGSQFSSHIDRSKCVHAKLFEPWPMVAVAAAACRTVDLLRRSKASKGATQGGGLRQAQLFRVQFHDVFVDFSYILPVLARSVDEGIEFRRVEREAEAAERNETVPEDDEGEKAAKLQERDDIVTALTSSFKGLTDEVFEAFVANRLIPKQVPLRPAAAGGATARPADAAVAAEESEQLGSTQIRALDVLVVLTIMCGGTPMQKLSMLYCLFADDCEWRLDAVPRQVWLHARLAEDCADSLRCHLCVEQVHDLLLTAATAMRRVGVSVADVPLCMTDLDAAAASVPKAGTLALVKRHAAPARRFKAAAHLVLAALRAGVTEALHIRRGGSPQAGAAATAASPTRGSPDSFAVGAASAAPANVPPIMLPGAAAAAAARRPSSSSPATAAEGEGEGGQAEEALSTHDDPADGGGGMFSVVNALQVRVAQKGLVAATVRSHQHHHEQLQREKHEQLLQRGRRASAAGDATLLLLQQSPGPRRTSFDAASSPVAAPAASALLRSPPPLHLNLHHPPPPLLPHLATDDEAGLRRHFEDETRRDRLRGLVGDCLDDDAPGMVAPVMIRRLNEAEEAAAAAPPTGFAPPKARFRFVRGPVFLAAPAAAAAVAPPPPELEASGAASPAPAARARQPRRGSVSSITADAAAPAADGALLLLGSPDGPSSPSSRAPRPPVLAARAAGQSALLSAASGGGRAAADAPAPALAPVPAALLAPDALAAAAGTGAPVVPSDSEWCLALAATLTHAPERWRRLSAAKRKALGNIPAGRTLRCGPILWDMYGQADAALAQAAAEVAADTRAARLCLGIFEAETGVAAAAAVAGVGAAPASTAAAAAPAAAAPAAAGSRLRLSSVSSVLGASPPSPGRGGFAAATAPHQQHHHQQQQQHALVARTVTNAQAAAAAEVLRRADALLATPVSATLLFDWAVTHPVPRYVARQLSYPVGRVATYDGLEAPVPPAAARHRVLRAGAPASGAAQLTKAEQARQLARLMAALGLGIADLRPLREAYLAGMPHAACALSPERFRSLLTEFVTALSDARSESSMLHALQRAKFDAAVRDGVQPGGPGWPDDLPITMPPAPQPPPAFAIMSEPARRKLLNRLFAVFDANGDGSVDFAEFGVGVSRVMRGTAQDKLGLMFDVYDLDGDGSVTHTELCRIMLRALRLSEDAESDAERGGGDGGGAGDADRRQEEAVFARELANALDVNKDGCITQAEFFEVLRAEPIMYECFASSLGLPIGGFDAGDAGVEIAEAAKTGPIFDFRMLRLIRDRFSIDIMAGRGAGQAENDAKKPGGGRRRSVVDQDDSDDDDLLGGASLADGGDSGGGGGDDGGDDGGFGLDDGEAGDGASASGGAGAAAEDAAAAAAEEAAPGSASILTRAVDRHHFRRLLRDLWGCPEDALFLSDRVFEFLDADGSGSIDVRELYEGITGALRGSVEHRATFFYNLFDTEGQGHMESDQILRMLLAGSGREDVSQDDARAVLAKIDADGSGTVERDEFLDAVAEDPGIVDSLSRIFGKQSGAASAFMAFKAEDAVAVAAAGNEGSSVAGDDDDGDGSRSNRSSVYGGLTTGRRSARPSDSRSQTGESVRTAGSGGGGGGSSTARKAGAAASGAAASPAQLLTQLQSTGTLANANPHARSMRLTLREGLLVLGGGEDSAATADPLSSSHSASLQLLQQQTPGDPSAAVVPVIGVTANRRSERLRRRSVISLSPTLSGVALGALASVTGGSVPAGSSSSPSPAPPQQQQQRRSRLSSIATAAGGGEAAPEGTEAQQGRLASAFQLDTSWHAADDGGASSSSPPRLLQAPPPLLLAPLGDGNNATGLASPPRQQQQQQPLASPGQPPASVRPAGTARSLVADATAQLETARAAAAAADGGVGGAAADGGGGGTRHRASRTGLQRLLELERREAEAAAAAHARLAAQHPGLHFAPIAAAQPPLLLQSPVIRQSLLPALAGGLFSLPRLGGGGGGDEDDVEGEPREGLDALSELRSEEAVSPGPSSSPAGGGGGKDPPAVPLLSLATPAAASPRRPVAATSRVAATARSTARGAAEAAAAAAAVSLGSRADAMLALMQQKAADAAGTVAEAGAMATVRALEKRMRESAAVIARPAGMLESLRASVAEAERLGEEMKEARLARDSFAGLESSESPGGGGAAPAGRRGRTAAAPPLGRGGSSVTSRKGTTVGFSDIKGGLPHLPPLPFSRAAATARGHGSAAAGGGASSSTQRPTPAMVRGGNTPLASSRPAEGAEAQGLGGLGGLGPAQSAIRAAAALDAASQEGAAAGPGLVRPATADNNQPPQQQQPQSPLPPQSPRRLASLAATPPPAVAATAGKPRRSGSASGGGGRKSGRRGPRPAVYPNAKGAERWYRNDPDLAAILEGARGDPAELAARAAAMKASQGQAAQAERGAEAHAATLAVKRKMREMAEARARLATLRSEAAASGDPVAAAAAAAAIAAAAGGDGGFLSAAELRRQRAAATAASDPVVPLSVAVAIAATRALETAASSAAAVGVSVAEWEAAQLAAALESARGGGGLTARGGPSTPQSSHRQPLLLSSRAPLLLPQHHHHQPYAASSPHAAAAATQQPHQALSRVQGLRLEAATASIETWLLEPGQGSPAGHISSHSRSHSLSPAQHNSSSVLLGRGSPPLDRGSLRADGGGGAAEAEDNKILHQHLQLLHAGDAPAAAAAATLFRHHSARVRPASSGGRGGGLFSASPPPPDSAGGGGGGGGGRVSDPTFYFASAQTMSPVLAAMGVRPSRLAGLQYNSAAAPPETPPARARPATAGARVAHTPPPQPHQQASSPPSQQQQHGSNGGRVVQIAPLPPPPSTPTHGGSSSRGGGVTVLPASGASTFLRRSSRQPHDDPPLPPSSSRHAGGHDDMSVHGSHGALPQAQAGSVGGLQTPSHVRQSAAAVAAAHAILG